MCYKNHDGAAHLWSYEVSQQKWHSKKQYPDPVSCHVLASMLVNVHVNEMCCIYAEVTSTMVEEEPNELNQFLRRVHTPLNIASYTRGLSGP